MTVLKEMKLNKSPGNDGLSKKKKKKKKKKNLLYGVAQK